MHDYEFDGIEMADGTIYFSPDKGTTLYIKVDDQYTLPLNITEEQRGEIQIIFKEAYDANN